MKNETTIDYWNCLCNNNYIHSKTELFCESCMKIQSEQPNSKIEDVMEWLKLKHEDVLFLFEKTDCFGRADIRELINIEKELSKFVI